MKELVFQQNSLAIWTLVTSGYYYALVSLKEGYYWIVSKLILQCHGKP